MTTTEMTARLAALEAEATRVAAERTHLHRLLEKLACRLELLEHDRARRGLLATLAGLVPPGLGAVCVDEEYVAL